MWPNYKYNYLKHMVWVYLYFVSYALFVPEKRDLENKSFIKKYFLKNLIIFLSLVATQKKRKTKNILCCLVRIKIY